MLMDGAYGWYGNNGVRDDESHAYHGGYFMPRSTFYKICIYLLDQSSFLEFLFDYSYF